MHPPFFHTDHRSVVHVPHPASHTTGLRRTAPVVLPITVSHLVENPFIPTYLVEDVMQDEMPDTRPVMLRAVPAPRHKSLRDVIGRWLIRLGQRMILENHPG
ncbi:hypothetical protein SAMN04488515_0326 [Cognatiyoonia koreensis]|uniref:Uncharacterized protein n=1 Tax=Cognatiyoonia koreensis TaxID=364200 RepID=A0A1I0N0B7_9RHOB|nr:hypothetical protein [Cognatiyoonia koreensis]SEV94079.1 hypothetical protein SAMN04488515_0326 [Cognatiyoonia koreensis]